MKISSLIAELLFDYDCVIIPGLGGFIGNYSNARIHTAKMIAYPPGKGIIFNKNLQNNDGLLANALAQKAMITYAQANQLIDAFVLDCKSELQKGNKIIFEQLGFIFTDSENNLQFIPDYSTNFLLDSFGLFPVSAKQLFEQKSHNLQEVTLKPLSQKAANEHAVANKQEAKILALNPRPQKTWKYIAAAAVFIPLAFYLVWIPAKTDFFQTGKISFADLNPFKNQQKRYYYKSEHNIQPLSVITAPDIDSINYSELTLDENLKFIVQPALHNTLNIAETTHINRTEQPNTFAKNIHIIGGCFRDINNAHKLINSLKSKGYNAYILDQAGDLHRVAVADYQNQSEAQHALKQVRENGIPSAWILYK
jgi:hypothetical protein